jgi:branched-chain amino acid transport system ATP-binding protein
MLRIIKINTFYGNVQVLWDVSLRVEEKEIIALVGRNGAGKSTLLHTIVNLNPPRKSDWTEEGIFFRKSRIDGLSPEETVRLGIAIVPEGARVFPEMTVLDNLRLGSYLKKAKEKRKETMEEVYELFPRMKVLENQKARTLSGGERQMLAIGRALMSKPDLLLLDEPSLGLQPILVRRTFEAVRQINSQGMTILLVEQNVYRSLEISHRAYVMENGRIVLEGAGRDLLSNPHVKKAYLAM